MNKGRPTERESYLEPRIMVDLENHYPRRLAFASLAGVTPQTLHRLLNQEPCHEWEVKAVERAWHLFRGPAVCKLLNKPPKNLTEAENFQLRHLISELYPHALGAALGGRRVNPAAE
jgi:hypothetical protein